MMELFAGASEAHGVYEVRSGRADGKQHGKATTVREPVTLKLWQEHLDGGPGIGIIPIRSDSTASWGCIDVDTYPLDHKVLVERIAVYALPLVACRSKSGGAHLFLFLTQPVAAGALREKLRELAAGLGYGSCEIFPKQSEVLSNRGDLGNWLNMPYHDAARTLRHGFEPDGSPSSLDQFLTRAEAARVTFEALAGLTVATDQDVIQDGPPCLEHLASTGFPPQTRNNGLFALGVYFRKACPDDWEERLEAFNRERMSPPKASGELQTIIKSLRKKGYGYRCSEPPLNAHCNRMVCCTRKFGITNGTNGRGALPVFGSLTRQDTHPAIWFLDVEGKRLELLTEDLQSQTRFQRHMIERLGVMPPRVKETEWAAIINGLLENQVIIEAPHDASIDGLFRDLLEQWCTSRYQARERDEILLGKPWTHDGHTHFRAVDLQHYLTQQKFNYYTPPRIMARLRDLGGEARQMNFKGQVRSVWRLRAFDQPAPIDLPPLPAADAF